MVLLNVDATYKLLYFVYICVNEISVSVLTINDKAA